MAYPEKRRVTGKWLAASRGEIRWSAVERECLQNCGTASLQAYCNFV